MSYPQKPDVVDIRIHNRQCVRFQVADQRLVQSLDRLGNVRPTAPAQRTWLASITLACPEVRHDISHDPLCICAPLMVAYISLAPN